MRYFRWAICAELSASRLQHCGLFVSLAMGYRTDSGSFVSVSETNYRQPRPVCFRPETKHALAKDFPAVCFSFAKHAIRNTRDDPPFRLFRSPFFCFDSCPILRTIVKIWRWQLPSKLGVQPCPMLCAGGARPTENVL